MLSITDYISEHNLQKGGSLMYTVNNNRCNGEKMLLIPQSVLKDNKYSYVPTRFSQWS